MSFGYQPSKILAGRLTRRAIRKVARHLLNDLTAQRGNSTEVKVPFPIRYLVVCTDNTEPTSHVHYA